MLLVLVFWKIWSFLNKFFLFVFHYRLRCAYDILNDDNKRRDYDKWLHSGLCISYEGWLEKQKSGHFAMHFAASSKGRLMITEIGNLRFHCFFFYFVKYRSVPAREGKMDKNLLKVNKKELLRDSSWMNLGLGLVCCFCLNFFTTVVSLELVTRMILLLLSSESKSDNLW